MQILTLKLINIIKHEFCFQPNPGAPTYHIWILYDFLIHVCTLRFQFNFLTCPLPMGINGDSFFYSWLSVQPDFFNWLLSFLKRKWILICWQKANTRNTSYIWKQYEQANSIASMFTGPRQSKGRQPKYRLLKQLFYTAMHLHQLPNHYHRFNIFVIRITDNKTKAENFPFTNKTRFLRTKMKAQERIIWARRILVNKWK